MVMPTLRIKVVILVLKNLTMYLLPYLEIVLSSLQMCIDIYANRFFFYIAIISQFMIRLKNYYLTLILVKHPQQY